MREPDLCCTHTLVSPQIDRSKPPSAWPDPYLMLGVLKETTAPSCPPLKETLMMTMPSALSGIRAMESTQHLAPRFATNEILRRLGYDDTTIAQYHDDGVV